MKISPKLFASTVTFATACLVCLGPNEAGAAPKFGRVANQPWSGGVTVVNSIKTPITEVSKIDAKSRDIQFSQAKTKKPAPSGPTAPKTLSVNLQSRLLTEWAKAREEAKAEVLTFLHEKNIWNGFRTSRNELNFGEPTFLAGNDGRGFTIRGLITGNTLKTKLRVPSVNVGPVDIGNKPKDDPAFTIRFDVELTIEVELQGNRLVASSPVVKPTVHRPDATNATGELTLKIVEFFKGPSFINNLVGAINRRQFPIKTGLDDELAKLNPLLNQAAGKAAIQPGYNPATQNLTLTMLHQGPEPMIH